MAMTKSSSEEEFLSNSLMIRFRAAVKNNDVTQINRIISPENAQKFDKYGDTFLHLAAESGTIDIAKQLLKLGSNIHIENNNGITPLLCALKNSVEMVQTLLDDKTIINSNLLRHALFYGTEEIVQFLLLNTRDFEFPPISSLEISSTNESEIIDFRNTENLIKVFLHDKKYSLPKEKNYPLLIFFAAKIANESVLQLILDDCREYLAKSNDDLKRDDYYHEEVNFQGLSGQTALHYAVSQQRVSAVRFLLDHGADPNYVTSVKLTPLQYAARLENYEICQLLLNFGATVNLNADGVNNPLYLVCGRFSGIVFPGFDIFTLGMVDYFKNDVFNIEIMKLLLKNGAQPQMTAGNKVAHLLQLCDNHRFREIEILLEFGANIRVVDGDGNTALHRAVLKSDYLVIEFLLKKGFEIDVKNRDELTSFMLLVQNREKSSVKMMQYLVKLGASVNAKNSEGETVFHIAMCYNNYSAVLTLLELEDSLFKKNPHSENFLPTVSDCSFDPWKLSNVPFWRIRRVITSLISYVALKGENLNDYFIGLSEDKMKESILIFDETKLEFENLKTIKILKDEKSYFSLYDFLGRDIVTAMRIIKNPILREELLSYGKFNKFPCSKHLLEHRLDSVIAFEDCFDKIFNFFLTHGKTRLTSVVVEMILSYLSWRDLQILGSAIPELEY